MCKHKDHAMNDVISPGDVYVQCMNADIHIELACLHVIIVCHGKVWFGYENAPHNT
jgi:hypothetical protein